MNKPAPRAAVSKTAHYVPGERRLSGVEQPIKLSSNESPLGPSPRAITAYHALEPELFRYPDAAQHALRTALADIYGVEADRIVCGNGSDEVLSLLIRAYTGPGDEVILSQYSFGMCWTHAHMQAADVIVAPEPDCRINVDEILSRVTARTRLVLIASPNNPCGTYLPRAELHRLHGALPGNAILVVDAAYGDYVVAEDYDCGLELARRADNVFVTHTFSKLYGLAGLRVGWGYGPREVIDTLNRVRTPFNVNAAALSAAAAAVLDRQHTASVREHNNRWLARLLKEYRSLGLDAVPSVTNFILIRFPEGRHSAANAAEHLRASGIIPRPVNAGGPERSLRITIGLDSDNETVIATLRRFMSS
jgi:histidinol-phosphate aminotransferase